MVWTETASSGDALGPASQTANFSGMKPKTIARIIGGLFFLATLALALARHDENRN
jgi:hypothetical protein